MRTPNKGQQERRSLPSPPNYQEFACGSQLNFYLIVQEVREQIVRLEHANRELHKKLENQNKESVALMAEFEETGKMFESVQEENSKLLSMISQKEDFSTQLLKEVS